MSALPEGYPDDEGAAADALDNKQDAGLMRRNGQDKRGHRRALR